MWTREQIELFRNETEALLGEATLLLTTARRLLQSTSESWAKLPEEQRESNVGFPDRLEMYLLFKQWFKNTQEPSLNREAQVNIRAEEANLSQSFLREQDRLASREQREQVRIPTFLDLVKEATDYYIAEDSMKDAITDLEKVVKQTSLVLQNVDEETASLKEIPSEEAGLQVQKKVEEVRKNISEKKAYLQREVAISRLASFNQEVRRGVSDCLVVQSRILSNSEIGKHLTNDSILQSQYSRTLEGLTTIDETLNKKVPWLAPEDRKLFHERWKTRVLHAFLKAHEQVKENPGAVAPYTNMVEAFRLKCKENDWPPSFRDVARMTQIEAALDILDISMSLQTQSQVDEQQLSLNAKFEKLSQSVVQVIALAGYKKSIRERSRILQTPRMQASIERFHHLISAPDSTLSALALDAADSSKELASTEKEVQGTWKQLSIQQQEELKAPWKAEVLRVEEWANNEDKVTDRLLDILRNPEYPVPCLHEIQVRLVEPPASIRKATGSLADADIDAAIQTRLDEREQAAESDNESITFANPVLQSSPLTPLVGLEKARSSTRVLVWPVADLPIYPLETMAVGDGKNCVVRGIDGNGDYIVGKNLEKARVYRVPAKKVLPGVFEKGDTVTVSIKGRNVAMEHREPSNNKNSNERRSGKSRNGG